MSDKQARPLPEICWDEIKQARTYFMLDHAWDIELLFEKLEDGNPGACESDVGRYKAKITLDFNELRSREELRRTIVHEVAHLAAADFNVYAKVVEELEAKDRAYLDFVYDFVTERIVARLTAMYLRDVKPAVDMYEDSQPGLTGN